jgi:shikimate kinase
VALIGFMGCGKTTVGRLLAARLGYAFLDLDQWLERRQGKSIRQIFQESGEEAFRDLESSALAVSRRRWRRPGGGAGTEVNRVSGDKSSPGDLLRPCGDCLQP